MKGLLVKEDKYRLDSVGSRKKHGLKQRNQMKKVVYNKHKHLVQDDFQW